MQVHSVAKFKYFLPTGEQDGKISNTHHSFVLIIKPTKKKELNALQDHQLSRENCNSCLHVCNIMCTSCTWMHRKELPSIYRICPCISSFMLVMLYFFFNFLDTKSMPVAPADFAVISYVKLKLPTIIRDTCIRVKIFNRRPKLKLISKWRTLEHENKYWWWNKNKR